jgi:hypothetical protein
MGCRAATTVALERIHALRLRGYANAASHTGQARAGKGRAPAPKWRAGWGGDLLHGFNQLEDVGVWVESFEGLDLP